MKRDTPRRSKNRDQRENRETRTVVEGIITASDWNDDGDVVGIRLLTSDEEAFEIENGDMFINQIQHHIRASGTIKQNRLGNKSIFIKKCTLLDMNDDGAAVA